MKSDFERKRFIQRFVILAVILLAVVGIGIRFLFGGDEKRIAVILLMLAVGLVILFFISYREIGHTYREIEHVSDEMLRVLQGEDELPEEEYMQGTIGILYTNFYKMVTFLKESKEREMSEKVFLRDIMSDISHQLKTPLASLNVFIDLLLDDSFTDEEKRMRVLNESKNQLTRMEWMVLSLLKLARIEAGAIQFDRKECDLKLLLLQARDSVTYLTESREQEVYVICEDGRKLVCDGDWLVEAIINLLKNASDYSPEKTEITVEVEHNPVFTRIYVKDHGMGIAEKDLGNIFKRFYRVHHDVNPNSVGIGLSLTKSIVEGMGGKITVRSEEGTYTWFIITFVHVD